VNSTPATIPSPNDGPDPAASEYSEREHAAATALAAADGTAGTPGDGHLAAARVALAAADALAPVVAASTRHMDGLDAARDAWAFVEGVAASMPPHPSREIQVFNHEDGDGSTILFWHAGRLAAVGVVARDVANWSVTATWEMPKARPGFPADPRG
jgi:hypothetical protein